jgi:protein-S-isoprenylcysteine O-methyltransferase Ste14
MQSSKNNRGRFVSQASGTIVKKTNPKGNLLIILLLFSVLIILAYISAKAVKIIFRKNFKKDTIGGFTISISSLFFFCIGTCSFVLMNSSNSLGPKSSTPESYFLTGMLYIFLALIILIRGIYHCKHVNDEYNRDGESYLLGALEQEGWKPNHIRNFAEPIFIISIGHFLYSINWLAGLPIIFCGISVWIVLIVNPIRFGKPMQRNIDKLNKSYNRNSQFNEVPNF